MEKVKDSYNVDMLTQYLGKAALKNMRDAGQCERIKATRQWTTERLRQWVAGAVAGNFFVRPVRPAAELFAALRAWRLVRYLICPGHRNTSGIIGRQEDMAGFVARMADQPWKPVRALFFAEGFRASRRPWTGPGFLRHRHFFGKTANFFVFRETENLFDLIQGQRHRPALFLFVCGYLRCGTSTGFEPFRIDLRFCGYGQQQCVADATNASLQFRIVTQADFQAACKFTLRNPQQVADGLQTGSNL